MTTVAALNHGSTLTNGPLFIPANTVKTYNNQVNNTANRTLTGIMPHMHLIGKSIKAFCVTPSNDTIHLIDIPEWDFHWQYFYQFQKPILLPAGSVIYGQATYDNTNNNPNNPNNPPKNVSVGEGTEDEMFLIYMNISSYIPGDTNIVIDTLSHYPHDASCFQTIGINDFKQPDVNIYPNPTTGFVRLEGNNTNCVTTIYDSEGKVVYTIDKDPNEPIDIQHLNKGTYYLQIKTKNNEVVYKKLIRQ